MEGKWATRDKIKWWNGKKAVATVLRVRRIRRPASLRVLLSARIHPRIMRDRCLEV